MKQAISICRRAAVLLVFGASVGTGGFVHAQDVSNTRAARLTFVQGTVTAEGGDSSGGFTAQVNLPLLAGVRLSTDDDGQAEVEFEDGSLVRLTPNSTLSLDRMTVEPGSGGAAGVFTTGMSLLRGMAYVELRATAEYRYTLEAGGDVVSPVENTTVRVSFDEPPAVFAVLDGTAQVMRTNGQRGSGFQREVRAGESLRGDADDSARYMLTQEVAEDSWDQWNQDLDRSAVAEAANRTGARDGFAGAQGYGWSDLDANGSWYDVPGQGPVWQPQVAAADASFDPYGNGNWVASSAGGGGYVWASGYAWGWTPYRCGSWSYFGGFGWGWAPAAGCGGLGWGFAGVGRPVNVLHPPNGYRVPHVPPHRGPVRPILPARVALGAPSANQVFADGRLVAGTGQRHIDGLAVTPLQPVAGVSPSPGANASTFRGGRAPVGSALQRDFPVDRTTHAAILGQVSTQPSVVRRAEDSQPTVIRPGLNRSGTGNLGRSTAPAGAGQGSGAVYRAPAVRSAPETMPLQRASPSVSTPAPVQHGSPPPPAAAPRSTTAPASAAPPRASPK